MAGKMVSLFRSTDTGAPTLNGVAGSLITVLDACLITGYNFKTVTSINRSGQTATVYVQTGHGLPADGGPKVNISGANQSAYNGNFQYTYVDANYFTITVEGTPTTPATGSISSSIAPLGWNKPFTGTNLAAYQSTASDSTKMYWRVDDTASQVASHLGCELMTSITSYSNTFPSSSQNSGNPLYVIKSYTADSVSRRWIIVGDGYEVFIFSAHNYGGSEYMFATTHFGDPCSEMLSDPYGCLIYGTYNPATSAYSDGYSYSHQLSDSLSLQQGDRAHYFARSYLQTGRSVFAHKHGNFNLGSQYLGRGVVPYPNPADNGLHIGPVFLTDPYGIRARLRGLWQPLHTKPLGHGYLLPANQSPIGRRLFAISNVHASTVGGETHMDIDGPWR
jgi:hypothetical protein